jgi:tripartite-type tricarboxylate transporter receptor subunit TctC
MKKITAFSRLLAVTALALCTPFVTADEKWPSKPIRIIVPYAPGGGADAVIRVLTDRLGDRLGQPVVVENRPGASGYIGAKAVASAAPDGYTLLLGFDGSLVVAPHLIKAPFDALKDFTPITKINDATLILAAHPSVPAKSLRELIDYSKTQAAPLGFGSSGPGTTTHLAGELLALQSGARLQHVPYKGGGQAVTDVVGGQVPLIYTVIPTISGFTKDGRLRAIAVSSAKRTTVLPDVPTMAESGLSGFEVSSWYGLLAPARTPKEIVDRLQRELSAVVQLPEIRERYQKSGFEPVGNKPEEFAQQISADSARWGKLVKDMNLRIE